MNFLLESIATFCLLLLGLVFCGGMRGFSLEEGAKPEMLPLTSLQAIAASAQMAAPISIAVAPATTPPASASPVTPATQLELSAELRQVHLAHGTGSLALMLDFSSTVNFQTEYEIHGNRLGILISPVDRSALAAKIHDLEPAFGPVTVETESNLVHKLWLTLAEGVSPSDQTRSTSGLGRTLLLDFVSAAEDRSAEVPMQVPLGRLVNGRKASRGRGLNFYQYRWIAARDGAGSDVFVHRVDPARGDFDVKLAMAKGRIHARQTLSAIAQGESAAAGLNAGFFAISGNGDPLGLLVADGRLLSAPIYSRSAVGVFPGGSVLFGNPELSGHVRTKSGQLPIEALNQARVANKLVLYTPDYGARTGTRGSGFEAAVSSSGKIEKIGASDLAIPADGFVISYAGDVPAALESLRPAETVAYQYGLTPPWNSSLVAVGCGPRLVHSGEVVTNYEAEHFTRDFAMERAPRSGVGLTASGKLLLIAVDGRRPKQTAGVSLPELSQIFRALGGVDALNMDGGGSTTSWIAGQVINSPSDGRERAISSAFLVVGRQGPQRVASRPGVDERG